MNYLCFLILTTITQVQAFGQEPDLYELFRTALENESTSPQYLVVTVTDTNSGTTKEICTLAPFLEGAIHLEFSLDYDSTGVRTVREIALKSNERTFKFGNKDALKNIGFHKYPDKETLFNYWDSIEVSDYETHKSNDSFGVMYFGTSGKTEQLMFAHLMFINGMLTGNADITGELYFGDLSKLYPTHGN